ncbi:MAG: hypothetical protein FGM46_02415 [Ferruginibacter sp.]|nr:hypothetical protein [Ferruginibacter sp.]
MKPSFLLLICILWCNGVYAQSINSIFINLYTESLKKGSYNYINVDGLLSTGKYIPLDSNDIIFSSSAGVFTGNNLFLPLDFTEEKVDITVKLKNSSIREDFTMYVKRKEDDELPTLEDISLPKKNKIRKN